MLKRTTLYSPPYALPQSAHAFTARLRWPLEAVSEMCEQHCNSNQSPALNAAVRSSPTATWERTEGHVSSLQVGVLFEGIMSVKLLTGNPLECFETISSNQHQKPNLKSQRSVWSSFSCCLLIPNSWKGLGETAGGQQQSWRVEKQHTHTHRYTLTNTHTPPAAAV